MMRCGIWLVALRGRGQTKENIAVSTEYTWRRTVRFRLNELRIGNYIFFHDYERFKEFSFSSFFSFLLSFLGTSRYREAGLVLKQGDYIYRKANTEKGEKKRKKKKKQERKVCFVFVRGCRRTHEYDLSSFLSIF